MDDFTSKITIVYMWNIIKKKKKKKENLMEEDERMARERLNNDSVLKESVTIVRGSAYYVRPVR